jgi:hypothetical protein
MEPAARRVSLATKISGIPIIVRIAHWRHLSRSLLAFALCLGAPGAWASNSGEARVDAYVRETAVLLEPPIVDTLERIETTALRLLALRSYLRTGANAAERWSWSQEQIDAFVKTQEYRRVIAEVGEVKARFEAKNPGYTLYANTEVRSLDIQVQRWNENPGVASVAQAIHSAAVKELAKSNYADAPDAESVERFVGFLREWQPPRAAPLAAPGLSKHGQLRAIDFAIFKDGKLVAPTSLAAAEPIWEKQGWSAKLKEATEQTNFNGPLQSPHEPWHYEYDPPARAAKVASDCEKTEQAKC